MRSFKKMVKDKRGKILTLVVLLFVFNAFYKVKGVKLPQLNHITRDGSDGLEGMCIATNEDVYSAIDWTYQIPENYDDLPITVSHFLPNITSSIDCNFESHNECSNIWKSDVWSIPKHIDLNYQPIFDYRWEDFKTYLITKDTKLVDSRLDVLNGKLTVSVRSDQGVRMLLCESWLPEKHPCYTVSLGEITNKRITLQKYGEDSILSEYKSTVNVLSFDQWKTFEVTLSDVGNITIRDPLNNITLMQYNDDAPLKPIFMFMRSDVPSLWKIHENHFLFANTSISTRFGPEININSSEICISMYLSICKDCKISFYSKNDTDGNLLLHVDGNELESTWELIKITKSNYVDDTLQLFVTTESNSTDGRWMVDNIRMCCPTEIKVRSMANPENRTAFHLDDSNISCLALWMQHWRPRPLHILQDNLLPIISINESSTSNKLSWKRMAGYHPGLPYLIHYEGYHLCPATYQLRNASTLRIKSNGWVVTSNDDVTFSGLIPYTHYSIEFQEVVYGHTKVISFNTNETENITQYEGPKNVRINVTENSAKLFFDEPSCNDLYGRILHRYTIGNDTDNSVVSPGSSYTWQNLTPFTSYNLSIETSRNLNNFNTYNLRIIDYYNFTTKPDIAPAVIFVEPYEITENTVFLRYQLPKELGGIPQYISVKYCTSLTKKNCEYKIDNVTKCALWDHMYCTSVEKLIKRSYYKFSVSIKNKNTGRFGKDTDLQGNIFIDTKVPGIPSNLSHEVVNCSKENDYCHINISWNHPHMPLGEITAFEIVLKERDTDHDKFYNEIVLIDDRKYQRRYAYTMQYLPYSMKYNVSVRAVNSVFKGDYVSGTGEIDHIGQHIDQMPTVINETPNSLIIKIPPLDVRLSSSTLLIIMQGTSQAEVDEYISDLAQDELCQNDTETWIAKVVELSKNEPMFAEIGDATSMYSDYLQRDIINRELEPNKEYCINFVIQNTYNKVNHTVIYHLKHTHTTEYIVKSESSMKTAQIIVSVLALVLLAIIGVIIYRKRFNLPCYKVKQDGEHIYEAMPFDEYTEIPNVVYNQTYDKLNHS